VQAGPLPKRPRNQCRTASFRTGDDRSHLLGGGSVSQHTSHNSRHSRTGSTPIEIVVGGATIRLQGNIDGEGRVAEVDGAYFGGHIRPENRKADRKDRRLTGNRNDKRQCVVLICERPEKSPQVAKR